MKVSWVQGWGPCKGRKSGPTCAGEHPDRGADMTGAVSDLEVGLCCSLSPCRPSFRHALWDLTRGLSCTLLFLAADSYPCLQ